MDSEQQNDVSDRDSEYDSDSQEDPDFDILEETRSSLSRLSVKKDKSKDMSARRNASKAFEECVEEEQDLDKIVPDLDEKDQKSYETIQKIIKAGQIEKLKVEQCKVYLRKHGLRLTGSKDTLIQRIKEHTDILDGRGEEKYPQSSFVLNCKGDACTGDVVMFEQNVYEMFSIASRSATGPPCGTRIVAGRIVKESYGAKKQQHTFTVEVLWSKGEKPLPPLHPLLIKGRNLYRLKTLRQKWDDEAERQKKLSEKYARGSVARSNRETRLLEKEMQMMRKENRVSRDHKKKKTEAESKGNMPHQHQKNTAHCKGKLLHSLSMNSINKKDQAQLEVDKGQKDEEVKEDRNVVHKNVFSRENWIEERPYQRQPLTNVNLNDPSSYREQRGFRESIISNLTNVNLNDPSSYREQRGFRESIISNPSKSPLRMHNSNKHMLPMWRGSSYGGDTNRNNSPLRMHNSNAHNIPTWRGYSNGGYNYCSTIRSPLREQQKKPCRFYAQGRCYYGHSCKYLHDSVDV